MFLYNASLVLNFSTQLKALKAAASDRQNGTELLRAFAIKSALEMPLVKCLHLA